MLTSAPWMVVLLGVGLLAALLIFALFSFRGPEHRAAPPPAPPLYLPTLPPLTPTATPTDEPMMVGGSPSRTASGTPSPRSSSRRPTTTTATATERPTTTSSGSLTARYQATASYRDSFEARLTLANGSGRGQEWRVELLFTGNVKGIQASSPSGVSVTSQGNGWFVLRGTSPLAAGEDTTVNMTFSRTGGGDRPGQCSVNGDPCTIG